MTQLAERTADPFLILDKYSDFGVAPMEEKPRVNAIATISAGKRTPDGKPTRSREGEIFIHGEAPGLEAYLNKRGGKNLTIMFPSDDPRDFIQQRFAEYSASSLLAYGDENGITLINGNNRTYHEAGTAAYQAAIKRCKVSVSVYFALGEWIDNGVTSKCDVIFPDGFGLYRLRFTSSNSLRSIFSAVRHLASTTGGRVAYMPFELFIRYEEHSDGTGTKRTVPVWQCVTRPPQNIRLTAPAFRGILENGQAQREMLQLPAPERETMDMAATEAEVMDASTLDDEALEDVVGRLQHTPCDAEHWRKMWFAIVKDSHFDSDEARHNFIAEYTSGHYDSLTLFLADASEAMASQLIEAVRDEVEGRVYCKCNVEARYVTAASGNGWICASKACSFKRKDTGATPAPAQAEFVIPQGSVIKSNERIDIPAFPTDTEIPVDNTGLDSYAKKLAADYEQTDGSELVSEPVSEAASVLLSDAGENEEHGWPVHVQEVVNEATLKGFNLESSHGMSVFMEVTNAFLKSKKRATFGDLKDIDQTSAVVIKSAIAQGKIAPPQTDEITEGEVVPNE